MSMTMSTIYIKFVYIMWMSLANKITYIYSLRNQTFEFTGPKFSKLEYLYRFYWKNLAKVTGPNQFSLAMGHRTTAKVDDWCRDLENWRHCFYHIGTIIMRLTSYWLIIFSIRVSWFIWTIYGKKTSKSQINKSINSTYK